MRATIERLGVRSAGGSMIHRAKAGVFTVEAEEPCRPLCRNLAYHGHSGPIEFYDAVTGRLWLTFARLEGPARSRGEPNTRLQAPPVAEEPPLGAGEG